MVTIRAPWLEHAARALHPELFVTPPKEQPMTKLSDRLEALAEKAANTSLHPDDVAWVRFQLKKLLQDNLPTILQALKDKDL